MQKIKMMAVHRENRAALCLLLLLLCTFPEYASASGADVVSVSSSCNGDWQCVSRGRDISGLAHESASDWESYAAIGNLQISGNKIEFFEYPCQYLGAKTLTKEDSAWTFIEGFDEVRRLSVRNDTLFITSGLLIGGMQEAYIRDTMNAEVVASLRSGILNPTCLAGKWYVVREEWCCYGSQMIYEYPYKLTDTIHLDSSLAGASYADQKYVVIKVDGRMQKCSVSYTFDFAVGQQSLWLTPLSSRKGKQPVLYRRSNE
jgi:hypothetical protein